MGWETAISGYIHNKHLRTYWDCVYEIFESEKGHMFRQEKEKFWNDARALIFWDDIFP